MKVLLIGNYENSRQESMQRFGDLLLRGLPEAGCDVRLIKPKAVLGRLKAGADGLGKWLGYIDRFVFFRAPLQRAVHGADVVHICDHANAVYIPWLMGKPCVVTCHDMIAIRSALGMFPEKPTRWSGRVYQRRILRGLGLAQRIVCVSENTFSEVLSHVNLAPEKVVVVKNALNYPYRPMGKAEARESLKAMGLSMKQPFFLHVGGNEWYKNRIGVLRIFHQLTKHPRFNQHALVMVGKPFTREMQKLASENGFLGRVKVLDGISNESLRGLYSTAEALIFPSFYEGFGWPILEAQACGCLVVTTGRPPMTEVGGNAAIYIDPTDEIAAAKVIVDKISDSKTLRESGFVNAKKYSIEMMINGYLNSYKTVCSFDSNKSIKTCM